MLWTLLIAISSLCIPMGALDQVHRAGGGMAAYLVTSVLGIALAAGDVWLWLQIAASVERRISGRAEEVKERFLRVVYAVAFLWSVPSLALGVWLGMVATHWM
jgi:hypothetical protein